MTPPATLRQWVRYAAEVCHPKTHAGIYSWLRDWPQLKPLCGQLLVAAEAGESTTVQWEIVSEIDEILHVVRAKQAEKNFGKATVGKAADVLTKPAEIREREEQMRALRRKMKGAAEQPTLFDLPKAPPKTKKPPPERRFFERSANS